MQPSLEQITRIKCQASGVFDLGYSSYTHSKNGAGEEENAATSGRAE